MASGFHGTTYRLALLPVARVGMMYNVIEGEEIIVPWVSALALEWQDKTKPVSELPKINSYLFCDFYGPHNIGEGQDMWARGGGRDNVLPAKLNVQFEAH
jgi:hypothetical protein